VQTNKALKDKSCTPPQEGGKKAGYSKRGPPLIAETPQFLRLAPPLFFWGGVEKSSLGRPLNWVRNLPPKFCPKKPLSFLPRVIRPYYKHLGPPRCCKPCCGKKSPRKKARMPFWGFKMGGETPSHIDTFRCSPPI